MRGWSCTRAVVVALLLTGAAAGLASWAWGATPAAAQVRGAGAGVPVPCASARAALAAGRLTAAFRLYVGALGTAASQGCAVAGLDALPKSVPETGTPAQQRSCAQAAGLRAAGQLDDAQTVYVALLKVSPDLECARTGLLALVRQRVRTDCLVGRRLLDAHQYTLAITQFQAAVATAGVDRSGRCGAAGLLSVQDAQDALAPRLWDDWQGRILQWGLGLLWALGGLVLGAFVVLLVLGWSVRLLNWLDPKRLRPRLVPRVRLAPITGSIGEASGESFTTLLRGEILRVQTANRVDLQFVTNASDVQNLITAVKDVDARLGVWAQLASAFSWLWPWPTLVLQGQILPAGRNGAGITLSIGTGARLPTAITFWRHPPCPPPATVLSRTPAAPAASAAPAAPAAPPAPATAAATGGAGGSPTDPPSAQDYYDLVPAAATWAVYETARLSRTDSGLLTAPGAACNGYLAASYGLPRSDVDSDTFLLVAQSIDPANPSVRLSLLHRTREVADAKCDGYLDILSSWFKDREHPDLDRGIWGLPGA